MEPPDSGHSGNLLNGPLEVSFIQRVSCLDVLVFATFYQTGFTLVIAAQLRSSPLSFQSERERKCVSR